MKKVVVLTLLLLVCVGSLLAEDKDKRKKKSITDSIFNIEEATVLGKKKRMELMGLNVPLRFVPLNVSLLSAKVLERKGITEWVDAVRFLPGVRLGNQGGLWRRFYVGGSNMPAVLMVDGIRDDRQSINTFPLGDLASAESIEVLRGPAAILAGYGAMGGVINIVRKKVSPEFLANARFSYERWDVKKVNLGFGGKLIGPVEYMANLHYATFGGWRRMSPQRLSGMAALGATLGKSRVDVAFGFEDDHYTVELGAAPYMPGDMVDMATDKVVMHKGDRHPTADFGQVYNDFANDSHSRKGYNIKLDYVYTFTNGLKLKEVFAFDHSYHRTSGAGNLSYKSAKTPFEGADYKYYTEKNGVREATYVDIDSLRRFGASGFFPRHDTYNNTLELTGDAEIASTKHHYAIGWNWSLFDMRQYCGWDNGDTYGPGADVMLSVKNPELVQGYWIQNVSSIYLRKWYTNGIYFRDVFELNDKWKFMASGRMDFYKRRMMANFPTIDGKSFDYDKKDMGKWANFHASAFTWHVGAVYFPRPELSIHIAHGSAFTPNTTTYRVNNIYLDKNGNSINPDKEGDQIFKPERDYSFETGVRYTFNEWLDASVNFSYIRRTNMVTNVGTREVEEEQGDGTVEVTKMTVNAQVGRADMKTLDMDVTARILPTFSLRGALCLSDYRIRSIRESSAFPEYKQTGKNMRTTGVPRTTFYVFADYTVPTGIFKALSFHLSGNFRDKIFRDVTSRLYYPSLWLMDGGVFYTIKSHITLACNVNNIFNKEYFESSSPVQGTPRNYQVSVSYKF
ncbi:TonB-dependent receptor [Gabonibacter chumensis]|uniref:TonB-dependent receptor n=1 Tax=Gabonibacter chumensis TaxID=2972474 RepID=UPI002573995C|nr:TonB-dependent receptor [Gabonibacter chumensis]MCR9011448.1 TonB-dependent receptor [Gabonibacter chumensis]